MVTKNTPLKFKFRLDRVRLFAPQSKDELTAVRKWLTNEIPGFQYGSTALWLGFEKPRYCDGTGRMPGKNDFFEQWAPGSCENRTAMKDGLFKDGEPNNKWNKEHCVLNPHRDVVWDVTCENDNAYAVCEINVEFEFPEIDTDLNYIYRFWWQNKVRIRWKSVK